MTEMRGASETSVLDGEVLVVGGVWELDPESSETKSVDVAGDGFVRSGRGV